ncbi:MAG: hypothetical protein K940chlam7_00244 [Chlamydiae bacterium]|nr:hypothetical protein [Chlamydiota bacterium]
MVLQSSTETVSPDVTWMDLTNVKTTDECLGCGGSHPPITKSKARRAAEKSFWLISAIFNPALQFFTTGIADAIGLGTYRHGTNMKNYLNIRVNGADPGCGGSETGSAAGLNDSTYQESSKRRFYVFHPATGNIQTTYQEIITDDGEEIIIEAGEEKNILESCFERAWLGFLGPRFHAVLSGRVMFASAAEKGPVATIKQIAGILIGLFTPTLHVYFDDEFAACIIGKDPDYSMYAYRTPENVGITTAHFGFKGIVRQGFNRRIWKRVKQHPGRVALGVARIVLGTMGVYYASQQIATKRPSTLLLHFL